jgi:hypothetical protein
MDREFHKKMKEDPYSKADIRIVLKDIGKLDIDSIVEGTRKRKVRVAVRVDEESLDFSLGKRLVELVDGLEKKEVEVEFTTPLYPCLLGSDYERIKKKSNPKASCLSCSELYSADKDGNLSSCPHLGGIALGKGSLVRDRAMLLCYLSILEPMRKPAFRCTACRSYLSKKCEGLRGFMVISPSKMASSPNKTIKVISRS